MTAPQHTTHPRFVDPTDLICPRCGYMACPQPPAYLDADAPARPGTPQFSHRDGTALCPAADGTSCEPVEIETLPPRYGCCRRS